MVINFVDYSLNQGAPAGHESAETPIGHESVSLEVNLDPIKISFLHVRAFVDLQSCLGHIAPIPALEDAHTCMDRLEQRMRQMRISNGAISWDDFDGALVASLPAQFSMPEIERYTGIGCPKIHLRLYSTVMRAHGLDEAQLIMFFPMSLSGAVQRWFASLNASRRRTWDDLAQEFLRQFVFNTVIDVLSDSKKETPREALTAPRGHHGKALGMPRTHGRDLSTYTWAQRHVWCAPRGRNSTGPGAAYPLSVQVRGHLSLMRGVMPYAPRGISHGRNAMAHCYEAGLDKGKQATSPSHGHLDMAQAHTSMPLSGWHVQATIWVVGGYARQLWAILASCITTKLAPTFEFGKFKFLAPEMAGGSAMDALYEKMTQMEEALGEWPSEEGIVASWAEHTMNEIQVQRSLLETHDNFFEEKLVGFKVEMQSLMDDFKGTLQSYGEDVAVLKKDVFQGSSSGPEALSKVRVLEPKGFNDTETRRSWRTSYRTWSNSLKLLTDSCPIGVSTDSCPAGTP
ncbi:hypothetical protein CK203_088216 [Vitis vinifera]|uniref:Retrotransposon gag domain-containing protein n=1 Tax=Vitis vinifera TaxID=29760 RepID=A0A438FJM2_VITVI|nr:hypothetical protein CK203_088216 [Vitis vinifera]